MGPSKSGPGHKGPRRQSWAAIAGKALTGEGVISPAQDSSTAGDTALPRALLFALDAFPEAARSDLARAQLWKGPVVPLLRSAAVTVLHTLGSAQQASHDAPVRAKSNASAGTVASEAASDSEMDLFGVGTRAAVSQRELDHLRDRHQKVLRRQGTALQRCALRVRQLAADSEALLAALSSSTGQAHRMLETLSGSKLWDKPQK